ncbi:MFS transporter, partial [bacterium]|nr:MFS transporter [bacterium]
FTSLSSSPEEAYEWVGLAGALLLVCSSFAVIACIPYPKEFQAPSAAKEHFGNGFFRSIREALAFRSFRLLLYAFVLTMIAAQIPAALILFFVQDVLKGEDPSQYVLYYFIGAALGFPLWIWSVHRFSKTMLWMLGIGINTLFFFGVFFVPPHALSLFAWCVVGSGLGLGGVIGVPAAIQADVIEEDGDRSGERREGSFIGIWSIVKKLSAAVGVAGTLSLLSLLGYEPTTATEGNAGPHELSQFLEGALRTLYCLVPCVLNLSALYPILLLRKERELSCKG